MRNKKLLSIICAFIMMFTLTIAVVNSREVSAAESTKYYYGTTLASVDQGSTSITSSLSDGLKVTFKVASKDSSATYKHTLYMANFGLEFKFDNANFSETWFTLTDADNDTKWVKIYLKQNEGKIEYKLEDNQGGKTSYVDSGIATNKLSEGVKLSYDAARQTFKLDNVSLSLTNIVTKSFYKNMAKLAFGVNGVDSEGSDAVLLITKINEQSLKTTTSKFEGEARKNPVIISKADGSKADGEDEPITTAQAAQDVNAPANADYDFPYFCLDVLGTGWAVSVDDGDQTSGKTKQAIADVNSTLKVEIFTVYGQTDALITLNVKAVEDNTKIAFKNNDDQGLVDYIKSQGELGEAIAQGHLVAPKEDNTFEFPHIYKQEFDSYLQSNYIDNYYNVSVKVGYKAPGASGDFTYASSYAVKINQTGVWYFAYKFTDAAGNETVTKAFDVRVFDETAPTIKVSDEAQIIVNKEYTVPSATITDNASGVDSTFTKWTLYSVSDNGTRTEVKNIKLGEEGYEDSILKDGVLTPANVGDKYVVVYEACDKAGNVAENKEMTIEVVEGTPTYVDNPFNDFLRTALIVVACLAGLGIIILIFVKPSKRTLK